MLGFFPFFFFPFPLTKGIISCLQDTKSFSTASQLLFFPAHGYFIDKDTLSANSELQFSSEHSTVKDLQEMHFNLLLICLRVCLFIQGGGELADICFWTIQWHGFIFPPNICWPNPAPCCCPRLRSNLIIPLLPGCRGCCSFNLHRKTINLAAQRTFHI